MFAQLFHFITSALIFFHPGYPAPPVHTAPTFEIGTAVSVVVDTSPVPVVPTLADNPPVTFPALSGQVGTGGQAEASNGIRADLDPRMLRCQTNTPGRYVVFNATSIHNADAQIANGTCVVLSDAEVK